MNRTITLALIVVLALSASISCNRSRRRTSSDKPTVALVLKTLNHPFFVDMRRGAQEAADRLGVQLQVQAAEREIDVEKQMQIVENLIQTGIKVLCITPSGSREIVSALVKAQRRRRPDRDRRHARGRKGGVAMPACTRRRSSAPTTTRVASWRATTPSRPPAARRASAFWRASPVTKPAIRACAASATPLPATPGITIVASQPANWERDQGFNVFQNMLQAHPDIDTVFAASDLMALGAIEAIAAASKTGKIRVIGFDALDDAKKAIEAGTMEASVAQFPYEMGKAAVESAVKVMNGEETAARHHGQTRDGNQDDEASQRWIDWRRPAGARLRARSCRADSRNEAGGGGRSGGHDREGRGRRVRYREALPGSAARSSTTRRSTRS